MQQAVFVTEIGKPLTLGTRAIPEPKEGEVLIRVLSTLRMFYLSSSLSSND
jgi:NADPH2:quinone reductase